MARYKLRGLSVVDTESPDTKIIPMSADNADYQEYVAWLDAGNTPDPEFTPEEEQANTLREEAGDLKRELIKANTWLFRMLLEMYQVGVNNDLWSNSDFDPTIRQKAAAWKQKLDRLIELGDN